MESRTKENYLEVLREVDNIIQIKPKIILTDFERAEQNALKTVFPNTKVIGCFFRYIAK